MGAKKPTHEFKLGSIRVTVWKNQTADGKPWFNVRTSRLFKDDGKWRDADSFRRDDLPIVALAVNMAYEWIWKQSTKTSSIDDRE